MQRTYRAVPLLGFAAPKGDILIRARTDLEALEAARRAVGEGVAFDLCEGQRLVLTHLPARRWRTVPENDERED